MKKSIFIIILSVVVVLTIAVWFFKTYSFEDVQDLLLYPIILIILTWGLFIGISRIRSQRKGQPPEDEFSRKVMRKASSISFYVSIYAWLILSYIDDHVQFETHSVIGLGILVMVIIFVGFWTIFRFWGIRDE